MVILAIYQFQTLKGKLMDLCLCQFLYQNLIFVGKKMKEKKPCNKNYLYLVILLFLLVSVKNPAYGGH